VTASPGAERPRGRPIVFYDGACGLCHRFVRRVAAADAEGTLRFAPVGGATWNATFPGRPPPERLVFLGADGTSAEGAEGVLAAMTAAGGATARRARRLRLIPRPLRTAGYAVIAAVRRRIFAAPSGPCPVVPDDLRARFLP